MRDYDQSVESRLTKRQVSLLVSGMVRVREGDGQRVPEDGSGFVESDAVLAGIAAGFLLIPLEFHGVNSLC